MEPDPDGPLQRVERTLISVWCYITEAVSRFLRPQPTETANNNEASVHESRVESEPPDSGQTEADVTGEEASKEQSIVSLLSASSPVVAWERCIPDVDVKPKEEDCVTKENITEEQHSQTGNDHAGQLVTEGTNEHQGRQEKTEIKKWKSCEESETPEKDGEHATCGSGHMQLQEAVSDRMEPREEKELLSTVVLDDHRKVVETLEDIQDDDGGEIEEGLEVDSRIQEFAQTEDKDSNEETEKQRDSKVSPPVLGEVDNCEDASWRNLEIENVSNEKSIDVETQLSVCKDVCKDELANKNVQMTVFEQDLNTAANYQTPEEESDQDKSSWTIEEENASAQIVTSSKAVQQTEPDMTTFSFKEEDMLVRVIQMTSEKHVTFEEACENENSALSTVQAETQHLFYNELSSVVEQERVQFAINDEEYPNKPAAHGEPEQKGSRALEDENILTQSVTSKEDDSGRGEEQFNRKGNDCADQLVTEDMTLDQLRQEKTEIQILPTCTKKEDDGNKEHQENAAQEIEKKVEEADVWEEPVSTVRSDDFPKVDKDIEDESSEIQEVTEDDLEEESEIKQCTFREGDNNGELEKQSKSETAAVMLEDENICEDASQLSPKRENLLERSQEEHQHFVFKELEPGCPKVQSYLEGKSQEILEDEGEETKVDFDEESEVKQCIIREEESSDGETELQKGEAALLMLEDANICEDPSQLNTKCKNSEKKGEQVETQHTVCKELSKDELTDGNVQMTVLKEESLDKAASYQTTREESEQDKNTRAGEDGRQEESVLIRSITISKEDQGTEVETFSQIEHNQAGQDCSKAGEAKEELEDESGEFQQDDEEDFEDKSEVKQLAIREEDDSCGETGEQWGGEAFAALLEDENICDDASQLSPKNENLLERSQQEDHQHFVFKELLGVAEEERVQVTIIKEEESDKYATHEEPEQRNSSRAVGDVRQEEDFVTHRGEKGQGTGEKPFSLTDSEQAEPGCPKVDEAKDDLEEESQEILEDEGEETEVDFDEESEVKQCIITEVEKRNGETRELRKDEGVMLEDGNICEDVSQMIEKNKTVKCGNWEESETSEMDRERATGGSEHLRFKEAVSDRMDSNEEEEDLSIVLLDDLRKGVETLEDIQEDDEETEESFKEESNTQKCTPTEEEDSNEETKEQRDSKVSPPNLGDTDICEDASRLSLENENCSNVTTIDVETQLTVCKHLLEDELNDENVQVAFFEEEDLNSAENYQTPEEESEQDKSRWTIDEENVSAQRVTSSKAVQQTEPDTTEFSFTENVLVTCMETTSEKLVTVGESSTDVDSEETEEERLCNKEICTERVCTTIPVTVTAEGESAREINRGFNNIPPGVIEGQAALSHELNTQACKETPESVPEHNNELELDENTTQRFLERGNSKEIQTIHLPEEVEVFKSSGAGGGEHLLLRQGSTEDKNKLDLVVEEKAEGLQFVEDSEKQKSDNVNLELEHFSDEEELELLDTPMRTEIKQSDERFETYSADKSALQDGDKTVKLEMTREDDCERKDVLPADEGVDLTDETSPKSEEEKMTENHLGPGLVQSFSLQDYGNLKNSEEIKPEISDENSAELLQMVFDTYTERCTDDGELEQEIRDLNECTPLRVVGMAADLITGQSALSQHLEASNQAPFRGSQMTGAEITTDTETADETETTTPQDLLPISAEETKHEPQTSEKYSEDPAEEHQDVIDEDILDLWIESVMSNDTDRIKEPEPGLQNDQISEESSEKKQEVMEAISAAPASISETETSLTTLDSGFLDQSISETPIIKSGDTGLLADLNYNSEIICDFTTSNSASALIEDTVETLQSYSREERASSESRSCPDSGVSSPEPKYPNQETVTAQEKPEEAETNTVCGDDEEALTTKANDEATVSNISDEIQSPEQGRHTEDLEALLEEGSILTESTSGDEPQSEPEKQQFPLVATEPRWSEDNLIKSFSAPSRAEEEDDQSEVNGLMLDFAVQRSRIAVKNPRARPPTDPRSLIHKPSVDPTPSLPVPGKVPAGMPLGGLGIGIKLPGFGAGFPVLKKTQRAPRDEEKPETESQKVSEEKKEEDEKTDEGKNDEAPKRPKWMPPGQPGFGNPLMSELKTKLKKTPKE